MKNLIQTGLIISTMLLLAFGCSNPMNLAPSRSDGKSTSIEWGLTKAKTILPANYPSVNTFDLTMTAPGLADVTKVDVTGSSIVLNIVKAIWTVTIIGKDVDGNTIVQGTAPFDSNTSSSVYVPLRYISTGTGTGKMKLTVDWAAANATYPVDIATLEVTDPSGAKTTPTLVLDGTTTNFEMTNAVVGNYRLVFTLKSGKNTATLMESVLVVQNVETAGTISAYTSDFATPPNNLSSLTAVLSGANVNLTWTLPYTNTGDNIVVQRKLGTEDDTKYVSLTSTLSPMATTYTDTSGVVQGNGYVYRVALVNGLNAESPSWVMRSLYFAYNISSFADLSQVGSGYGPSGIAIDHDGLIYVSTPYNVVKIDQTGKATVLADTRGTGIALDREGNIYVADGGYGYIRKIDPDGTVSLFAGTGSSSSSGDGGAATSAGIGKPSGIAVDSNGNVFFADPYNSVIRKISPAGIITTFASGGLGSPQGIAFDLSGNLLVADEYGYIRMLSPTGLSTTIAGKGMQTYDGDGGLAKNQNIGSPYALFVDATGNICYADPQGYVREISLSGIISTIAGNGSASISGDGGTATSAGIGWPFGVAKDSAGALLIANGDVHLRRVGPDIPATSVSVTPSTLNLTVGGSPSATLTITLAPSNAGSAITWSSDTPSVASVDSNGVVRAVSSGTATITATTTNGKTDTCAVTVVEATAAPVFAPTEGLQSGAISVTISSTTPGASIRYTTNGVDPTASSGTVYTTGIPITLSTTFKAIAYKEGLVDSGVVTATYGIPVTYSYASNFTGANNTRTYFSSLFGIAVDSSNNLYIPDQGWNELYKYDSSGTYTAKWGSAGTTIGKFNSAAGVVIVGNKIYVGDYQRRIQQFNLDGTAPVSFGTAVDFGNKGVMALAADTAGRIYAFDAVNVTRWNSDGTKDSSFLIADSARINYAFTPSQGIAVDSQGNVYVASVNGEGLILKYDATGAYVATIDHSYSWFPQGMATDASDNLYVVAGSVIHIYNSGGTKIGTVGTGGSGTGNGDLNSPYGLAVSADGANIWVTDNGSSNKRITRFTRN